MKRIVFFLTLSLFVLKSFGQAPTNPKYSRDQYLEKSKTYKTVGRILLGAGATCVITAIVIPRGEMIHEAGFMPATYENDGTKGALFISGLCAAVVSIPFFYASERNKRKASVLTIDFSNQKIIVPQKNAFVSKTQPSLTLRIKL